MESSKFSRRQALKVIAAAGGGLALGFVPAAWKTPVVEGGTLPVHAQTSNPGPVETPPGPVETPPAPACAGDLCAVAVTTTRVEVLGDISPSNEPLRVASEDYADFDFTMCTPNGLRIWNGSSGDGATSSEDNINFTPRLNNETLNIGAAVAGTYSIYLQTFEEVPVEMSLEFITPAGTFTRSLTLEEATHVADIVYPGGALTWVLEPGSPECGGEGDPLDCTGAKAACKNKGK